MVVREDGSKWACQSCLKGHRVSGCTHTDRELVLVPKKGRPTTQCQHCRQERKRRSAHVKCDCGELDRPHHPKEKCIHLREAEEKVIKARAANEEDLSEDQDGHLAAVAGEQGCCCHHGGKCTCALLKREDSQDGLFPHQYPAVPKPKLDSHRSEGLLTVFANGHHKPVHRKNHAAHECGMPYKIPMARAHTAEHAVARAARRSVDNLLLNVSKPCAGRSVQPARRNSARRMSKSEQASPKLAPLSCSNMTGINEPDFTAIDFAGYVPSQGLGVHQIASDTIFTPLEPMSGMADYSFDPWSAYPSSESQYMPDNNPFGVWPTGALDVAQPALTAASSGTQSEVDEIPMMDDFEPGMPSIQEDDGNFDSDGLPARSPSSNRRSLPANFFGNVDLAMPNANSQRQTQLSAFAGMGDDHKASGGTLSMTLDGVWQIPAFIDDSVIMPASTDGFMRATSSRQNARSVGSVIGPNDDLMRSLFPEMDFVVNINTQPLPMADASKTVAFTSQLDVTDAPASAFDAFQDNDEFISQPWADGSVNVPNDPFPSPFAFDQDFPSQDYSPGWSQ